jgi:hypothetical protein
MFALIIPMGDFFSPGSPPPRPMPSPPVDPGWGVSAPVYPSHGLPGAPVYPSQGLPWAPGHPSQGLPSPGYPTTGPIYGGGHPSQGLPWAPGHPSTGPIYGGGYPSHGLPSTGHPSHPIAIPVPPPSGAPGIPPEWTKPSTPPEFVIVWVPGVGWVTAPLGQPPTKPAEPAQPKK